MTAIPPVGTFESGQKKRTAGRSGSCVRSSTARESSCPVNALSKRTAYDCATASPANSPRIGLPVEDDDAAGAHVVERSVSTPEHNPEHPDSEDEGERKRHYPDRSASP